MAKVTVRETSTTLLMLFPDEIVRALKMGPNGKLTSPLAALQEFCVRADRLASLTARAAHADGAARARGLLCRWTGSLESRIAILCDVLSAVETKLSLAERDLGHAAIEAPVHGDFDSIR